MSGKGQGYVLNHKEATCCEGKARSYEIGVSAAAGIAIGTSAVGFEGYNKWSGDGKHCEFKYGQLQEVCGGLALGLGIDMTVANGWWKDADSTKGQSSFAGATLCFGICFGGEYVVDTSFSQIGWVISSGLGFGGDISAGHCNAWTLWEQKAWQWNLQGKCPAGGCFPSDAQVTTPSGVKTMRELKAGDRVLTADSKGKLIFDEVYFFGHAEEKLAPYVKLQLQRLQSSSAAPESLELSPDHYVHVCLESGTCELTKAKTMYASDVTVGNHVWLCTLDVGSCELGEVISTSMVPRMGLYNTFTLSGNIVVNGVLASAHSSWFLDGLFSAKLRGFLPSIYQTILLPGRCLYGIFGSRAADWLGVNNPQWAQGASQWPAVLAVFGPIPILLCAGLLALRRSHSKLG